MSKIIFTVLLVAVFSTGSTQARIVYGVRTGLGLSQVIIQTDNENYSHQTETIRKKEKLFLHLSISPVNSFLMVTKNADAKVRTGIIGSSFGLDYRYLYNQFILLEALAISSFYEIPSSNDGDIISSWSINLSNNHKFGRFSLGYGFSYVEYTLGRLWWFSVITTESHNAFGLVFPAYYYAAKYFKMGVVYRPTFYRPNMTDRFLYEHLISIDFAFKIRLI